MGHKILSADKPSRTRRIFTTALLSGAVLCLATAASAESIQIMVPANSGWSDTGVDVKPGERVEVFAAGRWSAGGNPAAPFVGPEGLTNSLFAETLVPSAPFSSLVGRVASESFPVGHLTIVSRTGRLFLAINDIPGGESDNAGYMAVTIKTMPAALPPAAANTP